SRTPSKNGSAAQASPPGETFRQGVLSKLDQPRNRVGLDTPPPSGSGGSTSGAGWSRQARPAGLGGLDKLDHRDWVVSTSSTTGVRT
ncbi:hypothetical protein, partial [Nocardioides sp. NPDC047086]|uniref:hypothetical protein n=1 Tax=Nocardioides sp. NPDC047086 TaxID=3154810 RepID=UPI0033F781A1